MATGLTATTFQYVPWAPGTFNCVYSRRTDLDVREFKIHCDDATVAKTSLKIANYWKLERISGTAQELN